MSGARYTRAAAQCAYLAARVGERLRRYDASGQWPWPDHESDDELAAWLYRLARQRLEIARLRAGRAPRVLDGAPKRDEPDAS